MDTSTVNNQIKGGEYAHTEACIVGHSDAHNERSKPINNDNIRQELTNHNTIWKSLDVPDLSVLDNTIRLDYWRTERITVRNGKKTRFHRKMPMIGRTKAAPIKETILLLPSNGSETDNMVKQFVHKVEQFIKWKCVRIYIHRDEYFTDPDTAQTHPNCHAHIVWDTYNWERHECTHPRKSDYRKFQDFAAEATGMPRGEDARKSRAKHLGVHAFKASEERKRGKMLAEKNEILQREIETLQDKERDYLKKKNTLEHTIAKTEGTLKEYLYENYHYFMRTGEQLLQQFKDLSKYIAPELGEQQIKKDLEEACQIGEDVIANQEIITRIDILQSLIEKMMVIIMRMINQVIHLAKEARKNLYINLTGKKILSRFIPQDVQTDLAIIEELKERCEESEAKYMAAEARRLHTVKLAQKQGVELDEDILFDRIKATMDSIPHKSVTGVHYIQKLMAGETIVINAGAQSLRFEVRYNYQLGEIEMRVNDSATKIAAGWSPDIKTAELRHHNTILQMYPITPVIKQKKISQHL